MRKSIEPAPGTKIEKFAMQGLFFKKMLNRNVLKMPGRKSTDVQAIPTCDDQLDLWCLGLLTVIQKLSLWYTHSVCQIINLTLFLDHVVHHTYFLGIHSELQPQSVPYSQGALTRPPQLLCRMLHTGQRLSGYF